MNELHLFAGAGGGVLGGELLGHRTVCAVEIEEYPRRVLLQRQRDGILPLFPIWDDISTFDGKPWRGIVDIVAGGFPCQDISVAGKGKGIEGERSGLWGEMSRVVDEVRPKFVFVENSPMLTSRGLGRVLGDLAKMGYNARWCVLGADDIGAPHRRKRIWMLGYSSDNGLPATEKRKSIDERSNNSKTRKKQTRKFTGSGKTRINETVEWWEYDPAENLSAPEIMQRYGFNINGEYSESQKCKPGECDSERDFSNADEHNERTNKRIQPKSKERERSEYREQSSTRRSRSTKPELGRVAHGVADRANRLKAIGNGQVPAVAATAFSILSEGLI